MSYIDIAFLVLFIAIMIRGFFRGFIKEAISLLGVFAAYLGANTQVRIISPNRFIAKR
jgi:Colicin V production protein.